MKATVIITAMDRKEFILDALASVLKARDSANTNIDVIVIKNFKDGHIDKKISNFGIKNIYSRHLGLGQKIIECLEFTQGEFVLFLEDDDKFLEGKLTRFFHVLRSYPNSVFYHNSFETVYLDSKLDAKRKTLNQRDDILIDANEKKFNKTVELAIRSSVFHNLSSMAIKTDILRSFSDILKKVTLSLDHVLFLIALDSSKPIFVDHVVSTRILIHNSASKPSLDPRYIKSKREFLLKSIQELNLCRENLRHDYSIEACSDFILQIELHLKLLEANGKLDTPEQLLRLLKLTIKRRSFVILIMTIMLLPSKILGVLNVNIYFVLARIFK